MCTLVVLPLCQALLFTSFYAVCMGIKKEVNDLFCDPLGARTQDPNIKSVVLYQLS